MANTHVNKVCLERNNVAIRFADGHRMVLVYKHGTADVLQSIELHGAGDVAVLYNPLDAKADPGIQRRKDGYSIQLFILYVEEAMEACKEKSGELRAKTAKLPKEISHLELIARKENS